MKVLKNKVFLIKNLHLLTSIIVIIPVALSYGIFPNSDLLKLLDIRIETITLTGIFRAIMGLYLGFTAIWIYGIIKPAFWTTATLTNIVFMGGLAFGRLLSLAMDGLPSVFFLVGLFLEMIFAIWGIINMRKYSNTISL